MSDMPRKKKCPPEGAADWLLTYGDMVTLLLTFFVMLFTVSQVDEHKMQLIIAAFSGLGIFEGGNTLEPGELAEMGHTIMALPSQERGRSLDTARKEAISQFQPEIKTKKSTGYGRRAGIDYFSGCGFVLPGSKRGGGYRSGPGTAAADSRFASYSAG